MKGLKDGQVGQIKEDNNLDKGWVLNAKWIEWIKEWIVYNWLQNQEEISSNPILW